jgi:hypothetical protein
MSVCREDFVSWCLPASPLDVSSQQDCSLHEDKKHHRNGEICPGLIILKTEHGLLLIILSNRFQ